MPPSALEPHPRPAARPLPPLTLAAGVPVLLALALILTYAVQVLGGFTDQWALTADGLRQGRFQTLLTSMFAHLGIVHLAMNLIALVGLSAEYRLKAGRSAASDLAYLAVLLVGGIAGGLVYAAIEPTYGAVGFSGAICALWGLNARLALRSPAARPLTDRRVLMVLRQFAVMNLVLWALLAVLGGGLAWQAHLGGFLLGLAAAPAVARVAARS